MPIAENPKHISHESNCSFIKKYLENCDSIIDYAKKNHSRYDLSYFFNVYPDKEIKNDIEYIKIIKRNFDKANFKTSSGHLECTNKIKKMSESLEIIITDQIKFGNWLGVYSLPFRTTEYDDFVNSVDIVAKFDIKRVNYQGMFHLSIDSTSHDSSDSISKKINRNISNLLSNKLEVKYYKSPTLDNGNDYKGRIRDIIPVVIGLNPAHTVELINLFSSFISLKKIIEETSQSDDEQHIANKKEFEQIKLEIEKNPCQLIFLREINYQLDMYSCILTRESKENKEKIRVKLSTIGKLKKIINDVINEKEDINNSPEMEKLKNTDTVYHLICSPSIEESFSKNCFFISTPVKSK